jgi:hypothetical protein
MKNSILIKTVIIAASLPLLAGCIVERQPRRVVVVQQPAATGTVVVEDPAPPLPQVEVIPVAPDPAFIWIGGSWEWRGRWVWGAGHWGPRPHPDAVWVHGGWERRGERRVWVESHWR